MSHKQSKREDSLSRRREATTQITSRLFARVSHDLGSPMSALRGYIKMVVDGRAGSLTDTQREYLTIALQNADRLCIFANRLGKIPDLIDQLEAEVFDVRDEWAEAVSERRSTLFAKGVTVTERSPDRLVIVGDRMQLKRAFGRVLDVSILSALRGNEILGEFFRGGEQDVIIRISLSGDGIPTGADLSAVHNIIFLHGGNVSLETQSATGSRCIINLPEASSRI